MSSVAVEEGEHTVVQALHKIKALVKDPETVDGEALTSSCRLLSQECQKGLPEKMLATKNQGYEILIEACQVKDIDLKTETMKALTDLLDGNPDSLDTKGYGVILIGRSPEILI